MLPRFLAPALDPGAERIALPADEAHHLTRVLRLGAGDEGEVFDGRGREFRARVLTAGRDHAEVTLIEALPAAEAPGVPLTLVQAVLKADGMDAVVRDATMLGVAAIVPVLSAHVAVPGRVRASGKGAERWRRIALASAKQCRRATLPEIPEPRALDGWLASPPGGLRLILVEPSAGVPSRSLRDYLAATVPERVSLLVGPEGGWAASEVGAAIESGCMPISLGPLTLRADAVPIVALAMCRVVFAKEKRVKGKG
jgi:16S rRNA (uracil1498-N3)-methyltransferase